MISGRTNQGAARKSVELDYNTIKLWSLIVPPIGRCMSGWMETIDEYSLPWESCIASCGRIDESSLQDPTTVIEE